MKKWLLSLLCGMVLSTNAQAGDCRQYMLSGTYLTTVSGWALVATTPFPIFAPVVALGVASVDESGNLTGVGPLAVSTGGQTTSDSFSSGSSITLASDCTVTFKATCAGGCSWEGTGYFNRTTNELDMMFTKSTGYPVTATIKMKQVAK